MREPHPSKENLVDRADGATSMSEGHRRTLMHSGLAALLWAVAACGAIDTEQMERLKKMFGSSEDKKE